MSLMFMCEQIICHVLLKCSLLINYSVSANSFSFSSIHVLGNTRKRDRHHYSRNWHGQRRLSINVSEDASSQYVFQI